VGNADRHCHCPHRRRRRHRPDPRLRSSQQRRRRAGDRHSRRPGRYLSGARPAAAGPGDPRAARRPGRPARSRSARLRHQRLSRPRFVVETQRGGLDLGSLPISQAEIEAQLRRRLGDLGGAVQRRHELVAAARRGAGSRQACTPLQDRKRLPTISRRRTSSCACSTSRKTRSAAPVAVSFQNQSVSWRLDGFADPASAASRQYAFRSSTAKRRISGAENPSRGSAAPCRAANRRHGRRSRRSRARSARPPANCSACSGEARAPSSLGGGKGEGRGAEGVGPSHRKQGNGQQGEGFGA
jgi:hypothetical protein